MSFISKLARTASITAAVTAAILSLSARPASAGVTTQNGLLSVGLTGSEWTSHEEAGYDFGIGYNAEAYGVAVDWNTWLPGSNNNGFTLRASGNLEVPATIFGDSFSLFKLSADAIASTNHGPVVARATYELVTLGFVLKSGSRELPVSTLLASACYPVAGADASFSFAGIHIDVEAGAGGCMYVKANASADLGQQTLTFKAIPSASIDASLGVGFSVSHIGSVGIHGGINIIDVALPVPVTVKLLQSGAQITESGSISVVGMAGDVSVKATAFGATLFDEKIFGWDGVTFANKSLFTEAQTFNW